MTNEERDLITQFIGRVGGPAGGGGGFAGSVPSGAQALPPVDRDADALIGELFNRYPEARYRITQVAFVQEHALANAQQQIAQLQQALQQARAQGGQQGGASPWGQQGGQQQPQSRGFFGSLFGGGQQQAPQQQYAQPQYQQPQYAQPGGSMMQPQGTGFLGGALRTAAGVAGGVVAADALMGLFSNHGGGGGGLFGGGGGFGNGASQGGEFLVGPGESPWGGGQAGSGFAPDPFDQGGAPKDANFGGQDVADNSAWSPAPDQGSSSDGGWQQADNTDTGGGGWDNSSSDGGGWDSSSDS